MSRSIKFPCAHSFDCGTHTRIEPPFAKAMASGNGSGDKGLQGNKSERQIFQDGTPVSTMDCLVSTIAFQIGIFAN